MGRRREPVPDVILPLQVESLDLEGQGVAHHDGKVVFVSGALPGERVMARLVRRKPRHDVARTVAVSRASSSRVAPRCPNFGVCGGCSIQHIEPFAQVAFKQRVLEETLWHLARTRPEQILPPIVGPAWGYRYRARLTVRNVPKKGGVLVGFHERGSSYVADMTECHTMPPHVSALLPRMRRLVEGLSIRDRLPQIEVAVGDRDRELITALVFRVLLEPSEADLVALRAFCQEHALEGWLQPRGPETIVPLPGTTPRPLGYSLPDFNLWMGFAPTEFTQVNSGINQVLVSRAIGLLAPEPEDRVVDLFCGLGNFSLPLATRSRQVVGIEGSKELVRRAEETALANGFGTADRPGHEVSFETADLFAFDEARWQALGRVDRLLIDPPRDGAQAVARVLADTPAPPRRVVYVSCNPATLARDVGMLVNEGGWRLKAAGVINMFAQTSHVESIVVLEPGDGPRPAAVVPVSVVAAGDAEDGEQVAEHVVDADVDAERGGDVIRLAAVNDALQVVQNEQREDHDGHGRQGQHQGRDLQPDVGDDANKQHDEANRQPPAH